MKWSYDRTRKIVVGFVNSEEIRDFGVSYTDITTKMDKIVWNIAGSYGTWIEQVGDTSAADSKCLNFYFENLNLINDSLHQSRISSLYDCPCNLDNLGAQWWGYSSTQSKEDKKTFIFCLVFASYAKERLSRLYGNPYNRLCCYTVPYDPSVRGGGESWLYTWEHAQYISFRDPNAGHLLLNDPWLNQGRISIAQDFNPHKWCCQESTSPYYYCGLFNQVRPETGCTLEPEIVTGAAVGDPHIFTLDGRQYTFNGLGQFILMYVLKIDFMLQARTQQVLNSLGNKTAATVFVAFAAKEGNYSRFQVELDSLQTGMVILANDMDITLDFYSTQGYNKTFGNNDITLIRGLQNNQTMLKVIFTSGISLKFYVGFKYLEFLVDVPVVYKGKLRGLLGNFNDNPDDDFILPNSSILTGDKINTDKKIFYNFGKEWEVTTSNTIFTYSSGKTALDYQYPEFIPLFIEDIDSGILQEAQKKCGDNVACTYDFAVTRSEQFASNSKKASQEIETIKMKQTNKAPVLTFNSSQLNSKQQWEVTSGIKSALNFTAMDADGDNITYHLAGTMHQSINIDTNTGVLTYIPNASFPVIIGVQATDSKGESSPVIYLDLVICSKCSNAGICDLSSTRQNEMKNGRFLFHSCLCLAAYTGEDCESELDACKANPCLAGQICADKTAQEQGNSNIGYTCGSCPKGYELIDGVCVDENECFSNETTSPCPEHSQCENFIGSYKCTCHTGYTIDFYNTSRCKDIDECIEGTNSCQHLCKNEEGSYTCACLPGSMLNTDRRTCQPDPTISSQCDLKGCHQACSSSNGSVACSCFIGYKLNNETHCSDINECLLPNPPCSQSCLNTNGSFQCSCYPGYKLNSDGLTCTVCPEPYYGVNCSGICVCNGHGTCHQVKGCECSPGWSGEQCNQDVNECAVDGVCPMGQICVNMLGSFECRCPSGYENLIGQCKDFNECLDVLDNNCDLSVENCMNNEGSYTCECQTGYARNSYNICADIDECAINSYNCEQICENTQGKYNCKCKDGYKLNIDRTTCIKTDIDKCLGELNLTCSHICSVDKVTKTPSCSCKTGYILEGAEKCVDINECQFDQLNLCNFKDRCLNTDGGFRCSCPSGYSLDNDGQSCLACGQGKWGQECSNECACSTGAVRCDPYKGCVCKSGFTGTRCEKDLDECSTGLVICGLGERCINTIGSASCHCLAGYSNIDGKCQDLNECANALTNNCSQVCQNYAGGYTCSCHTGYLYEAANKTCKDIDECQLNLHNCEQRCENTGGGYRCSCLDGWKLNTDRVSCIETSKCTNKVCSDKCTAVDGVETCFCPKGKELDPKNNSKCVDVDMCRGDPCSDTCVESNDGSSFLCSCPPGKQLAADSITCSDCLEGKFGINCTGKCDCNTTNSVFCDKINGSCTCKTGWTSTLCDVDTDECKTGNLCPLHSKCINTYGSYLCKCDVGYFKNADQCQACPFGTYGEECKNQCTCDLTHSTCDAMSGHCTCHDGWSGAPCDTDINECMNKNNSCPALDRTNWVCINTLGSYKCSCEVGYVDYINNGCIDIDECLNGIHDCQQECSNEVGSFSCSCKAGYHLNETNKKTCYKSAEYTFQLKIMIDVNDKNLKEKQGKDYLELKSLIEFVLRDIIGKTVKSLRKIDVLNLRLGSLIADFSLVLEVGSETNPLGKLIEEFIHIAESGIKMDGLIQKATVIVGNTTVMPRADKCWILETIESCGSDEKCQLNGEGIANCRKILEIEKDANTSLILGLTLGLTLGLALIIVIACCIRYRRKYTQQRRNDNSSSERSFSIRGPKHMPYHDLNFDTPFPNRMTRGFNKGNVYALRNVKRL
ncbi:hypothetical protein Btru_028587 [Bulinus truncatus]|nr:hypothetical protein Btru_028587 [Bulinus truncatus]